MSKFSFIHYMLKRIFTPEIPQLLVEERVVAFLKEHGPSPALSIYDSFPDATKIENIKPREYISLIKIHEALIDLEDEGVVRHEEIPNTKPILYIYSLTGWNRRHKKTNPALQPDYNPIGIFS